LIDRAGHRPIGTTTKQCTGASTDRCIGGRVRPLIASPHYRPAANRLRSPGWAARARRCEPDGWPGERLRAEVGRPSLPRDWSIGRQIDRPPQRVADSLINPSIGASADGCIGVSPRLDTRLESSSHRRVVAPSPRRLVHHRLVHLQPRTGHPKYNHQSPVFKPMLLPSRPPAAGRRRRRWPP